MATDTRDLFSKFASINKDGAQLMNRTDFLNAMINVGGIASNAAHPNQGLLFFDIIDTKNTGEISFDQFNNFYNLLKDSNAEYNIIFRLFDTLNSGKISLDDFKNVLMKNAPDTLELGALSKSSDFIKLYFGTDKYPKSLKLDEFAQFLSGIQQERVRQQFLNRDPEGSGFITVQQFTELLRETSQHKMSPFISLHFPEIANVYAIGGLVSWPTIKAFHNVILQSDTIRDIISQSTEDVISSDKYLTREEFASSARYFTPLEVDIIFRLVNWNKVSKGEILDLNRITHEDARVALEAPYYLQLNSTVINTPPSDDIKQQEKEKEIPLWARLIAPIYNFGLGSIAGAVGATVVYPIDLVKTRMQNQRKAVVGELMYRNSLDCFRKVIRNEGILGLYSGLGPQLIGVAPEKAIKLTMNDLVRGLVVDKNTNEIPLWGEILAGCVAGGSQVVFTNPLEIVKIRLQVQGEVASAQRKTAIGIIRQLGLVGLYKGASACLLRDIPFSGIYFTAYAHLKSDYFGESSTHKLSYGELLLSGAIAGIPAAYLTTPADVIKTRLQVEAKKGQSSYNGMGHAFRTIYKEEGFAAFFKGGPARVFRSSPQFGVTLLTYEILKQMFPLSWSHESIDSTIPSSVSNTVIDTRASTSSNGWFKLKKTMNLLQDINYKFGVPVVKEQNDE